jgi:uncharacterized protein Yka (UPF0111/DUF47 family)
MKAETHTIEELTHDIKAYKYWVDEIKKELRVAKNYGWSMNEIKRAGDALKKLRLSIKQKETILNTIK